MPTARGIKTRLSRTTYRLPGSSDRTRRACYRRHPMAPAAGQPAEPSGGPGTYRNPVLASYLGDPFVLRAAGRFYAFGTQPLGPPGIPAYRSDDLVHWEPLGDVLERLPAPVDACWAPEVAYSNGRFWMYFSGGGAAGEGHGLRVASAPVPEGPYRL